MWKILQQDTPDDFVLSTGVMHSVRQFVEMAFNHVKVKIAWEGEGTDEVGKDAVNNLNINIKLMHLIFSNFIIAHCTLTILLFRLQE